MVERSSLGEGLALASTECTVHTTLTSQRTIQKSYKAESVSSVFSLLKFCSLAYGKFMRTHAVAES